LKTEKVTKKERKDILVKFKEGRGGEESVSFISRKKNMNYFNTINK
jgi:hypothetical protein